MKNKSLIAVIIALAAVIILAAAVYPSLSEKATEQIIESSSADTTQEERSDLEKATDFTVYNSKGEQVSLSDFIGKPIIINFWASWCGYCLYEMPDFDAVYKKYGDEIHFLIINKDDGIKRGESIIKEYGYSFPTYYDLEYDASTIYGASSIPRTIALDKDGYIHYNRAGMIDANKLESIIDMIR